MYTLCAALIREPHRSCCHLRCPCTCSHACYGSYAVSFPALLPFLAGMPGALLCAAPQRPAAVAAALWGGCQCLTSDPARDAAVECFRVITFSPCMLAQFLTGCTSASFPPHLMCALVHLHLIRAA